MMRPGAMLATKTHYTFADLLEHDDQGHLDEYLYEVLGGELVAHAAPNTAHGAAVAQLFGLLYDAMRAGYGWARTAPGAVALDFTQHGIQAEDVPQPDLFFVLRDRKPIFGERCVMEAPDLVIEVLSPTTRRDDLPGGRKFAIYERYGVPYYWIVDTDARTIAQYTWQDGRYGPPAVLRPGDTLNCPLFPTITRDVAEIFAELD